MTSPKLACLAALVLAVGCSGKTLTTDGGSTTGGDGGGGCSTSAPSACACHASSDCASLGSLYQCNPTSFTCFFQCGQASDCTGPEAPSTVQSQCSQAPLGCVCQYDKSSGLSQCVTKVCGTDADCGANMACIDAACQTPPAASQAVTCSVFPAYQVLEVGQSFTFTAEAYGSDGLPLHLAQSAFAWSAGDSSVTAGTASATGEAITGASPSPSTTATASVVAKAGGATCTASTLVFGAPSGPLRVIAVDTLSGLPVSGATVKVEGAANTKTTLADGEADFASADLTGASAPYTVSVFDNSYGYVTLVNTTSTDLIVGLLRNALDNEGGVSGMMNNLFIMSDNVHIGLVGMSIAGGLTDISFDLLLGPGVPTTISLAGDTVNVALPSGVMIGLSEDTPFKGTFSSLGAAGNCPDNLTGSQNGVCGVRTLWGLGGDVPLDEIPITQISQASGGGSIDIGSILSSLLPVFNGFTSSIIRDQEFKLGPTIVPDGGGSNVVDPQYLTPNINLDLSPTAGPPTGHGVTLGLQETLKVPTLPKLGGNYVSGALALAGVSTPGRGLTPLGLTAGTDEGANPSDPTMNTGSVVDENQTPGQLILRMAPAHGGLEGSPYKIVMLAASLTDLSGGLSASGILESPGACSSANSNSGICYGGTLAAPASGFLPFPEGATYSFGTRRFNMPTSTVAGDVYRLTFEDNAQHRWNVFFTPSAGGGFTVPTPAAGFVDRSFTNDTAGGPLDTFTIVALDFGGVGLNTLDAFNNSGFHTDNIDALTQRFAVANYPPPSISISSPSNGGTLSSTGTVTVSIANDDSNSNDWYVCWTPTTSSGPITSTATNCTAGTSAPSGGGQTTGMLPSGASGTVLVHALLTDTSGAPLVPPVESVVSVTIQ